MDFVVKAEDRELFKRCRRAWDFGARVRQNLEPAPPARVFNFDRAIRDALAVYYFPGMWDWDREVVQPLILTAFEKSMRRQRDDPLLGRPYTGEEEEDWERHLALGEAMLKEYAEWGSKVDNFIPVRVETNFDVNIPDPWNEGVDLKSFTGVPIRYQGRIQILVVDEYDAYWIIDHRVNDERWEATDHLLLDDRATSYCWAWEQFFLGMTIAGIIYNEMRKVPDPSFMIPEPTPLAAESGASSHERAPTAGHRRMYVKAAKEPDQRVKQEGNERFRRTQIARSSTELLNLRKQMILEALDMSHPDIRLYPNPTKDNCSACDYRSPCLAMNTGSDVAVILQTSYRKRPEEIEEGRIGGTTWSMNRGAAPPKFYGRKKKERS